MIAYLVLFILILYLLYQEGKMLIIYLRLRKNNSLVKTGELKGIVQPHDSSPIYHVNIKDGSFKYSIKLKTTILASLVPRIMGDSFEVMVNEEDNYCILKSPIPFFISGALLIFGIVILIKFSFLVQ
jgi:hypothetical protein